MRNLLVNFLFLISLVIFINCQGSRYLIKESREVDKNRVVNLNFENGKYKKYFKELKK